MIVDALLQKGGKRVKPGIEEALLELALRGYTVRRARELMEEKGFRLDNLPDAYLVNIMRRVDPALRADLNDRTLTEYGLASKLERVRRLCEGAEVIEGLAGTSPKWSGEYRRYIAQVQAELEPLGIQISAHDGWAKLLQSLVDLGKGKVDVVQGSTAPAGSDT